MAAARPLHARRAVIPRTRVTAALAAAAICAASCAPSSAGTSPGDRSRTGSGGKGDYYGTDDRQQIHESSDPRVARWARSIAIMVAASKLSDRGDGTYGATSPTMTDRYGLCPDERFASEIAFGFCSTFLVAPDVLATAGHCLMQYSCDDVAFVFDYYAGGASEDISRIPADRVFACRELIARRYVPGGLDYALVRLDRPVEDREPLPLQLEPPAIGARVALLGFPNGILAKIDTAGEVVAHDAINVTTSLDSFKGHSGAAAIDVATGRVFGVHVAGSDGEFRYEGDCTRFLGCAAVNPGAPECLGSIEVLVSAFGGTVDDPPDPGEPTDPMDPGEPGLHDPVDNDTPLCLGDGGACTTDEDCGWVAYTCEGVNLVTESLSVRGRCDAGICADARAVVQPVCEDLGFVLSSFWRMCGPFE